MNSEIKRLLKLSSIPGFKLSAKEQATLDAWKASQVKITPRRKTRSKASKTASKAPLEPETVENTLEKVQKVIRTEDLTLNSES